MGDAGFFRGTSFEQDNRFTDKQKKLLKTLKFHENLSQKVDMKKVNLDILKPWITNRVTEILGVEDDVVIEYIFSQLEEKDIDPRLMQINMTGFLNAKRAREFIGELWQLMLDAQATSDGIPVQLVELKKEELRKKQEEDKSNNEKSAAAFAAVRETTRAVADDKSDREYVPKRANAPERRPNDRLPESSSSRFRDDSFRKRSRSPRRRDDIPRRRRSTSRDRRPAENRPRMETTSRREGHAKTEKTGDISRDSPQPNGAGLVRIKQEPQSPDLKNTGEKPDFKNKPDDRKRGRRRSSESGSDNSAHKIRLPPLEKDSKQPPKENSEDLNSARQYRKRVASGSSRSSSSASPPPKREYRSHRRSPSPRGKRRADDERPKIMSRERSPRDRRQASTPEPKPRNELPKKERLDVRVLPKTLEKQVEKHEPKKPEEVEKPRSDKDSKKRKKKDKKRKDKTREKDKEKKRKKHKKRKRASSESTASESESDIEDDKPKVQKRLAEGKFGEKLDDLEVALREKALRSMKKQS